VLDLHHHLDELMADAAALQFLKGVLLLPHDTNLLLLSCPQLLLESGTNILLTHSSGPPGTGALVLLNYVSAPRMVLHALHPIATSANAV
jgi:hypothetical protein